MTDDNDPYMTNARPKARNLMGVIILVFFLTLYMFGAAAIGDLLEEWGVWRWAQIPYYLVAGLVWLIPARWIFRWIAKGSTADTETNKAAE